MEILAQKIQALLFVEGGALSIKRLETSLECTREELQAALENLKGALEGTGIALVLSDTEAALVISQTGKDAVVTQLRAEYERDIGAAGLEVLAILLYEGPSTRATIDYIRGVNSASSVRNLLVRGLIERTGNPTDGREFLYRPTAELLAHLGIRDRSELPEYDILSRELAAFKAEEHHAAATDERRE